MKVKTVELSGRGGGYEEACQKLLWIGIDWIKDKPLEIWEKSDDGQRNEGISTVGVYSTEHDALKELDKKFWALDYGISGMQHWTAMGHLKMIHHYGYKWWIAEGKKHREPEDFKEFDLDTIPLEATQELIDFIEG